MYKMPTTKNLNESGNDIKEMERSILYKNPILKKYFNECEFIFQKPLAISRIALNKKFTHQQNIFMLGDAAGATTVRAADGRWGSSGNAAAGPGFMQLISGASRGAALMRLEGGKRAVDYLGASGPLRLATFEAPDRAFTVLGLGDGFAIFVPTGEGGAAMQRIDSVGGVVGPLAVMGAQPSDATAWVCLAAGVVGSAGAASGAMLRRAWRLKSAAAERR